MKHTNKLFVDTLKPQQRMSAAEIINKHLQDANRELIHKLGVKLKGVERGHYGLGTHMLSEIVPVSKKISGSSSVISQL